MFDLVQFAPELAEFLVQAFVFGLEQVFEKRVLPLHAFGRRQDFLAHLSLRLFTQVLQDVQFIFHDFLTLQTPQLPGGCCASSQDFILIVLVA